MKRRPFLRHEPGSVLTVAFELEGQACVALNGGPQFKFNEAVSLQVMCNQQEEVRLSAGGFSRSAEIAAAAARSLGLSNCPLMYGVVNR